MWSLIALLYLAFPRFFFDMPLKFSLNARNGGVPHLSCFIAFMVWFLPVGLVRALRLRIWTILWSFGDRFPSCGIMSMAWIIFVIRCLLFSINLSTNITEFLKIRTLLSFQRIHTTTPGMRFHALLIRLLVDMVDHQLLKVRQIESLFLLVCLKTKAISSHSTQVVGHVLRMWLSVSLSFSQRAHWEVLMKPRRYRLFQVSALLCMTSQENRVILGQVPLV